MVSSKNDFFCCGQRVVGGPEAFVKLSTSPSGGSFSLGDQATP